MPTHDEDARFLREWRHLTRGQQARFASVLPAFVHDVRSGQFRPGFRVRGYQGQEGVFEMTWAPDGRALFRYGDEVRHGERHIEWLRIGTHDIF